MAKDKKKYFSFTGLKEFYYGELDEEKDEIKEDEAEHLKFLQSITVAVPQDFHKAYGDNEVAEIAISTDSVELTSQFHVIPIQDRATLYGWKKDDDDDGEDEYYLPENPNPPYVASMFSRTSEDGGKEWLGFPKGKYTMPEIEGETKEDSVDFSNDETSGQFMPRKVEGYSEKTPFLIKKDKPGETKKRDKMYKQIFGKPHPDEEDDA